MTVSLDGMRETAEAEALLAADVFGRALRASGEFQALAAAAAQLDDDSVAQRTIRVVNGRRAELRVQILTGALDDAERAELDDLDAAMRGLPSVAAYIAAEERLRAVCRAVAEVVSGEIGVDFAANAGGSCCG